MPLPGEGDFPKTYDLFLSRILQDSLPRRRGPGVPSFIDPYQALPQRQSTPRIGTHFFFFSENFCPYQRYFESSNFPLGPPSDAL